MQWSVPQHADVLERLESALTDAPGAVLVGPDGVGKSTLLRQAADRYAVAYPDAAPPAIRALWDDALLRRIDIESPSRAASYDDILDFVAQLPLPAREVLDLPSLQEPVPLADLIALTSEDAVRAVAALERLAGSLKLTRGVATRPSLDPGPGRGSDSGKS